jgi:hypothetical protein
MSGSAPQLRARSGRPGLIAAALVLVLLVPVGFLFLQAYDSVTDRRSATAREVDGVAYLRALGHLSFTVADAQAAAVAGRDADRDALATAVAQVAAVDERLGNDLRTHERWTGVRAKIESVRGAPPADPEAALIAYREVSDLLLALYAKVRDESGLVHDPDADAYHLLEGVASNLPAAVIAAGRLADLAVLAPKRAEGTQPATFADTALARVTLVTASSRLVDGLRSAADDTESRTLSGNLLSSLDRFQLAIEEVISGAGQAGLPAADPSIIVIDRAEVQAAASELSSSIFNEVDGLLRARDDELGRERMLLLGAAAVALVLAVLAVVVLTMGARSARVSDRLAARAPTTPPDDPGGPRARTGPAAPDEPGAWAPQPIGAARWERSGAAR